MEIVKLGDICNISTGNKNKDDECFNGENYYPFYTRSTKILKSNDYSFDGECIIVPGEGIFTPMWNDGKCAIHQRVYKIITKDSFKLKNKYLFFWWTKNQNILYKEATGSTVKSLRKNNFETPLIALPNIEQQQVIIDIIEPFEKMKNFISNKLHKIEKIIEIIINNESKIIDTFFNEKIKFNKGINFKSEMVTENKSALLFINVSSINNNPNKFIHEEYKNLVNVIEGDVILSLDGNTGLVNNFLKGINGYGYKITSNKYENYQLYYSLLARINQNIIKQNSHGTTIMHATRAKEKILILDFFNNNILSIFYKLELNYKSQLKLINSNIELLIEKYII